MFAIFKDRKTYLKKSSQNLIQIYPDYTFNFPAEVKLFEGFDIFFKIPQK